MLRKTLHSLIAACAFVGASALVLTTITPQVAVAADEDRELDVVWLNENGRPTELKGRILREFEDKIVFQIVYAGGLTGERHISRDVIISITRGDAVEATDKEGRDNDADADNNEPELEIHRLPEEATKVYMVKLEGEMGWEVTPKALELLFEDVDYQFDDIIEVPAAGGGTRTVVDPSTSEKHIVVLDYKVHSPEWMGGGDTDAAEQIANVVSDQIERGRRVVFWVEEGLDSGALIPWASPEMVFRPTADLRRNFDLDDAKFGKGEGGKTVDEKMYSLRVANAKGIANKGGYDIESQYVIPALVGSRYWLAYKLEGGEPVYLNREPTPAELESGYVLLSDNGKEENADDGFNVVNAPDRVRLTAEIMHTLGITPQPAETLDELMQQSLGERFYVELEEHKGQEAMQAWMDELEEAAKVVRVEVYRGREGFGVDITGSVFRDIRRAGAVFANEQASAVERMRAMSKIVSACTQGITVLEQYEQLDPGLGLKDEFKIIRTDARLGIELGASVLARIQELNRRQY